MTTMFGTGGQGFAVSPTALHTHASEVSQLGDQLSHAIDSAERAVLGDQAFGHISVALAFASLIKAVAEPGMSTLSQARTMLTTVNRTITTTAANYDSVEQSNTCRFQPGPGGSAGSSSSTNPLSAGHSTTTGRRSGGNIVNDVQSLEKDISSGSWIQAGLAGMHVVSDAAQILSNPVGAIVSYGLHFLLSAVKPLQEAVGWLVGNPGQVSSYGDSWQHVAQSVNQIGNSFTATVRKDTANWTGSSADGYRAYAAGQADNLSAVATATRAIGGATQVVGQLVKQVQGTIEKLVSQAMQQVIQTALSASFMITIPLVVAEVVNEVVSWIQKIAKVIQDLAGAFNKLEPLMSGLSQLFGHASRSLSSGVKPLAAINHDTVSGISLPTPVGRVTPVLPS
jgi:uncharacterized protein YukE